VNSLLSVSARIGHLVVMPADDTAPAASAAVGFSCSATVDLMLARLDLEQRVPCLRRQVLERHRHYDAIDLDAAHLQLAQHLDHLLRCAEHGLHLDQAAGVLATAPEHAGDGHPVAT
jgi:hypothetical protein